jgi:hypothetical protein
MIMLPEQEIAAGTEFNNWRVLHRDTQNTKGRGSRWVCECMLCGKQKPVSRKTLQEGRSKSCGCQIGRDAHKRLWQGVGDLSVRYITHLRCNAKRRNIPFNITVEDAWNKFVQQGYRCAISGEPIRITKTSSTKALRLLNTASLDRIDSNLGYTIDNIQWLHKDVNKMKLDHSQEKFIEWCRKITNYSSNFKGA